VLAEAEDPFGGEEADAGEVCEDEAEEGAVLAATEEARADVGFTPEAVETGDASLACTEEVKESVGVACCVVVEDDAAERSESRKVVVGPVVDMSTGAALVICIIFLKLQLKLLHISIGRYCPRVQVYYRLWKCVVSERVAGSESLDTPKL
jgi:hypothetical protein